MIITSFLSQCLLCAIFWQLSTPLEIDEDTTETETEFVEVHVEEFDEEAELQARIWNNFLRSVKGITASIRASATRSVTAAQIMRSMLQDQPQNQLAKSANTPNRRSMINDPSD